MARTKMTTEERWKREAELGKGRTWALETKAKLVPDAPLGGLEALGELLRVPRKRTTTKAPKPPSSKD